MNRKQRRAERENYFTRQELAGLMYEIQASGQRHEADPMQQIVRQLALREPPGHEHRQRLGSDAL
jgi:hypothetical protein